MPLRAASSGDYRYGFNGKENIDEVAGTGNWQDYGERMYSPRLGRFPNTDPIITYGQQYTWLSPYQFASLNPIGAIDLDGLEAFYMHGTWARNKPVPMQTIATVKEITRNTSAFALKWSGNNTDAARRNAAEQFADFIIANRDKSQPLTILGHSHGGNIGILTTNILKNRGYDVNYLITINTPVREYQLDKEVTAKHFNIYQENDPVQILGGNSANIPDGGYVVPGPAGLPIVTPTYWGSRKYSSGEFGYAGRTFKGAVNIGVTFSILFHNTHNSPELWKEQLNNFINPSLTNFNFKSLIKGQEMPADKTKVETPKYTPRFE